MLKFNITNREMYAILDLYYKLGEVNFDIEKLDATTRMEVESYWNVLKTFKKEH